MSAADDTETDASGVLGATVDNPYVTNPYHGDILPGTSNGSKLYLAATKPLEESKRLDLSIENAIVIKSVLTQAANTFGWDKCIATPTTWDPAGKPQSFANLLLNPDNCRMNMVKFHGAHIFGTPNYTTGGIPTMEIKPIDPQLNIDDRPIFQLRVRSEMISKWVYGNFDADAIRTIELQSPEFTWKRSQSDGGGFCLDGATMLKIILDEIAPSTTVGTDNYRKQIQNCRLPKFSYNVKECLEHIERCNKDILAQGETYDSLRLHTFDCLKSAKNSEFKTWVRRVESDISCGTGEYKNFTPAMVINAAKKMYLNMTATGEWDKLDPRDAQMIALLTTIKENTDRQSQRYDPSKKMAGGGGGSGPGGDGGGNSSASRNTYEEWQLTKTGDTKQVNGKTWWWCPNHNDGKGLYVRHPPKDHDRWLHSKKNRSDPTARYTPPNPAPNSASNASANTTDGGKKNDSDGGSSDVGRLELGNELKQVLCSYGLSNSDANSCWEQAVARASLN